MTVHRTLLPATAAALLILMTTAGCASAASWSPTVGIGDNNAPMFQDENYLALGTKITRKILPYDFYHHKAERDEFAAWMAGAESAGAEPLVSFSHSMHNPRKLPTVGAFQKSLRYLKSNYPEIRAFSPWNEANHRSQPTSNNPKRAAQFYNAARRICRGCRIVAADVLDQKNMLPWIAEFRRTAQKPNLWGVHSYVDVNRNVPYSRSSLRKLLRTVPGKVWLTEVGGLVAFARTYSYNEARASTGVKNTLRYGLRDRRIERIYLYCWYGSPQPHRKPYLWDSGLVSAASKPRPAYFALRSWIKSHPSALELK